MSKQAETVASRAADILDCDDLRREKVFVAQWNRSVYLQELGGRDASIIMQRIDEHGEKARWTPEEMTDVLSRSIVDADGQFIVRTDEDKARLSRKNWHALTYLFNKVILLGANLPQVVAQEKKD